MDPELKAKKLDFSGPELRQQQQHPLDRQRQGAVPVPNDWAGDTVLQRLDLTINTGDKPKQIRKPEGVAFDPGRLRMYVVSDRDADLYVFKLHDDC